MNDTSLFRQFLIKASMWPLWMSMLLAALVLANNETQAIAIFRSRPDIQAPILTPLLGFHDISKMAPGYFFVSPYQQLQTGIYIYDNDANLVYSGFGSAGPGVLHSPQTCMYKNEVHLCFYQGEQMLGWGHGHGIIMNKHYQIVRSIEPSGTEQASSDMHEFKLIDDGKRALMTQFHRLVYDLCDWNICDGLAYIQEGIFQEIDVESGEAVFVWHSLDHVDPSESYVGPATTEISGDGRSPTSPWDYFHINSIDKNDAGDYLISARHVSTIYKVSGKNGKVLWRFGGAKSDFKLDGFSFSFQHDARFISDNKDETVISFFDNGSNGFNTTQSLSTGLIVQINHLTGVARVIHQVDSPGNGHLSRSQGSYQILPNGNELMGWGSDAFWSEHTSEGEVVFYGMIGTENVMNYRVHKFDNWVGIPLTKPGIWIYSLNGYNTSGSRESYEGHQNENSMFVYMSWNGHTQIASWSCFCSSSKTSQTFNKIRSLRKKGFETIFKHDTSYKYCYAQAMDAENNVLGTTDIVQTFVPSEQMREYCDELACRFVPDDATRAREKEQKEQKLQNATKTEINTEEEEVQPTEDVQQASYSQQSATSPLYVLSWGVLASVMAVIALFAIRNFVGTSCIKGRKILIVDKILPTTRKATSNKNRYGRYHRIEEQSDEEVHLEGLHDEANHLMLRKDESIGLQGSR